MGIKSSMNTTSVLIEKYINSAYDTVKTVADNLDKVAIISNNEEAINLVANSIDNINTVASDLREAISEIETVAAALDQIETIYETLYPISSRGIVSDLISSGNLDVNSKKLYIHTAPFNIESFNTLTIHINGVYQDPFSSYTTEINTFEGIERKVIIFTELPNDSDVIVITTGRPTAPSITHVATTRSFERITVEGVAIAFELSNFTYVPHNNEILVFLNGVYQASGINYNEEAINSIGFTENLNQGDVIDIIKLV